MSHGSRPQANRPRNVTEWLYHWASRDLGLNLLQLASVIKGQLKRRFGTLLSGDEHDEVILIALERYWERHARFCGPTSPKRPAAWFQGIAMKVACDIVRSKWRVHCRQMLVVEPGRIASVAAITELDSLIQRRALRKLVDSFPEVQRQIMLRDAKSPAVRVSSIELALDLGRPRPPCAVIDIARCASAEHSWLAIDVA